MDHFTDINPKFADMRLHVPSDWRRPGITESYDILWDRPRAFGQIWPRPEVSAIPGYYEVEHYYTHTGHHRPKDAPRRLGQKLLDKFSWLSDAGTTADESWWEEQLSGEKQLEILEIGSGNGRTLKMFAAMGHHATGVEPDESALKILRAEGHEVHQGTAEDLPECLNGRRFDLVVFLHVLEHCLAPHQAIANAEQLLKPGGRVVAEVPNNDCLGASHFGTLWHWLDAPRHLNFFTEKSLGALFSSAGLTVEERCFSGYCRQFCAAWRQTQAHIARMLGMPRDRRVSPLSYWIYLAKTAAAPKRRKYDSVLLVGRKG